MATGYTAHLESLDYDLYKWLTESIPRAMGMCINLRDDSLDLSVVEIREKLVSSDSYYTESLAKDQKLLKEYLAKTPEQWQQELKEAYDNDASYQEKRKEEYIFKKDKHLESLRKVKDLISEAKDEVTLAVLQFAEEQLDSTIKWDYDKDLETSFKNAYDSCTWEQFRDLRIDMAESSIKMDEERLASIAETNAARLKAFDTYINFVEKLKDTIQ